MRCYYFLHQMCTGVKKSVKLLFMQTHVSLLVIYASSIVVLPIYSVYTLVEIA